MFGRLTKGEDFQRVREQGRRWRGKYCALNAARSAATENTNTAQTRIGYISAKSLGNAVNRNRARRLMREAARQLSDVIPDGWDIVLIAQQKIVEDKARMQQIRDDLLWLLNKANIGTRTPPTTLAQTAVTPATPPSPASS